MRLADTRNARVTVRVIDGTGRVTAHASVIDMSTNDSQNRVFVEVVFAHAVRVRVRAVIFASTVDSLFTCT